AEAARSGVNAGRFSELVELHTVRLSPADLATAVLRSYLTEAEAQAAAKPQGVTPAMLKTLEDLAGDGIAPVDAARALQRGLIVQHGTGAASTSYDQAIRESRLHDKWGPILHGLATVLLSPADAADAVVRNFLTRAEGTSTAGKQGVDRTTFDTLVALSGDAPGPQQLAEALRRHLIPEAGVGAGSTSFEQGIAEGRLADKWAPVIRGLSQIWPTPTAALDAQLKGQISDAEGLALYERLGGAAEFHDWLLASIGDSPTPLEAALLAARGIIREHGLGPDVLSYDQAVKESRYRNKWGPAYRALGKHVPAPSTVATMLAHRSISEADAHKYLADADMDPAVAAAYLAQADYEATSDYRGLTESSVVSMYANHLITRDQAARILHGLHTSDAAAKLLLDYADQRYQIDSIQRSVQRIASLYTGRKIGESTAKHALIALSIPVATVDDILADWTEQARAAVHTLAPSQIVDAWYYKSISQGEAQEALEAIGYTAYDAWILLSNKAKGPIPGKPPREIAPPPGQVIPGTT
ncbi:MAG TPA: hypothetical protein VGS19_19955, partial [Streptosporangiaceae bacterium]|nr:hypothetical protein [Streptosporangiaceae bacterium]